MQETSFVLGARVSAQEAPPMERCELDEHLARHDKGIVVVLDLHIEPVNDRFGRVAGDRVLTAFALLLRQGLPRQDLTARSSGHQFTVLLPPSDPEATTALLAQLRTLWGRRAPHPCGFQASAVPVETTGRCAYERAVAEIQRSKGLRFLGGGDVVEAPVLTDAVTTHHLQVALACSRSLARAGHVNELEAVLRAAVIALGGHVTKSDDTRPAEGFDIAVSSSLPVLVSAQPDSPAWTALGSLLPGLLEDAKLAVRRLR